MNSKLCTIAALVFFFTACKKTDIRNEERTTAPVTAKAKPGLSFDPINFNVPNLFPEGVVYDPFHDRFLVSSTSTGDIGSVSFDGTYTPFIQDPVLLFTTGLEIDKARKRLLACNNGGVAQLAIYDLNTRERLHLVDLALFNPGLTHFINDVALDPEGNAYVTNSRLPIVYKVDTEGNASVLFNDPAFAVSGTGFNGIEYHNDGFLLVNFSVNNQVVKIPVAAPSAYSIVQLDAALSRPDGLLLSKDGKQLIVVNNAGGSAEGRVMSFVSKDGWATGTVTGSYTTGPVFPTTATGVGKTVYVLYAYLHLRPVGHSQFTIQPVPFENNRPF